MATSNENRLKPVVFPTHFSGFSRGAAQEFIPGRRSSNSSEFWGNSPRPFSLDIPQEHAYIRKNREKAMLVAVISDIHANLEALEAVLEDVDRVEADTVLCLGDVVGYGPDPNLCVEVVSRVAFACVAGNHDHAVLGQTDITYFNTYACEAVLWTRSVLAEEARAYLARCPLKDTFEQALLVHGSPVDPEDWNYIFSVGDAHRAFDRFEEPLCFVGHSHVPVVFDLDSRGFVEVREASRLVFEPGHRYIVNVGSVGQPRDWDPRAAYGLWDTEKNSFELRRLAYDVQTTQRKILAAGLPEFLATRLATGQ